MTIKTVLILGTTAINVAIEGVRVSGKKLDRDIQVAGLSCLNHLELHGDITVLSSLWLAMPKGSRKKALNDWCLKYGKLIQNVDAKGKVDQDKPFLYNKEGKTDLLGAENEPWFDCALDKLDDTDFNFLAKLAVLLKAADKAEAKGLPIEGLQALKAARAAALLVDAPCITSTAVNDVTGALPDAEEDAT